MKTCISFLFAAVVAALFLNVAAWRKIQAEHERVTKLILLNDQIFRLATNTLAITDIDDARLRALETNNLSTALEK